MSYWSLIGNAKTYKILISKKFLFSLQIAKNKEIKEEKTKKLTNWASKDWW